ncbi:uncharacterized protein LOC142628942 [Castanea sativa]|uniref:uncharacterized protein LOC142628942 n=1 Tax=Castanea sativa TaxID=21020 RepID=UPI003F65471C
MVLERLDRVLATHSSFALNPATRVQCFRSNVSDYYPIVIKLEGIVGKPCKPFRFEHMWLKECGCGDTVRATWVTPLPLSTSSSVHEKIKLCGDKLMEWSKCSIGSVKKLIEEKSKLLERAEFAAGLGADYETVRQRARALHLKSGDSNTSFFHNKAFQRFRRNRIVGLLDDTNSWCTDNSQIADIIVGFYRSLFTSARLADANTILEVIQPLVTEDMNINLTREFTKQEVDHE